VTNPTQGSLASPVREDAPVLEADSPASEPHERQRGIALCLSGGGYRAMVFHVGALWRLNEAGVVRRLARVSSVSGGSITAAVLGLNWPQLAFDGAGVASASSLGTALVEPVRRLAGRTVDEGSVIGGVLLPGSIADKVTDAYAHHLFRDATLQDLPAPGVGPRFVINATNVQTGALWRFSRPYMGDWRVGLVVSPEVSLARAVAASSAFPPVLSPLTLRLDPAQVRPVEGSDLHAADPHYRDTVVLTDGGVYDNLGLETAFKHYDTLLVSDAGQKMAPEPEPKGDWAQHAIRVMGLLDNQVRNLRKRQLVGAYTAAAGDALRREGAYWGIRSHFDDFAIGAAPPLPDPFGLSHYEPDALATIPTRLKRMPDVTQEKLINWGYAICDTALRRHAVAALAAFSANVGLPHGLPYPDSGL
jgi:NTE family protein